ncbi:MAG: N-acetylglucosamine-6-phosphate deacetylase, partial [Kordiimonas sp.]
MSKVYIADKLFDGHQMHQNVPVTVDGDIFEGLHTSVGAEEVRLEGTIVPGYIDVQVNGGGGALFNGDPTIDAIHRIFSAHSRFGTTGMLPTFITGDLADMQRAADAIAAAVKHGSKGILGVHFEGPHLSPAKKGTHTASYIRPISDAEMEVYAREDLGLRKITVAPDMVEPEQIKALVDMGVIVSLGHSGADYTTAKAALDAGATCFTHLFNAMSPFEGRRPGMVGAALLDPNSWCGIIIDDLHVHADSARLAVKAKPPGKMMLVTDAMPPVGSDETEFVLLGEKVTRTGNALRATEGQLAGSVLDMEGAVRNTVNSLGVELGEALRMASLYPAEFLGIGDKVGSIEAGKQADFLLLDEDLKV